MQPRSRQNRAGTLFAAFILLAASGPTSRGDELPMVLDVELQPLAAQASGSARPWTCSASRCRPRRGRPGSRRRSIDRRRAGGPGDPGGARPALPDRRRHQPREPRQGRARARRRPAGAARLAVFLVKVHNEAGVTAELRADEPQRRARSTAVDRQPRAQADDPAGARSPALDGRGDVPRPAAEADPLGARRSSTGCIQLYSRDAGQREAKIGFNVGQGTQDLGFRSDVDILFDVRAGRAGRARRPRRGRPADDGLVPDPRRAGPGLSRRQAAGSRPTSSSTPRSTGRPARRCSCRRARTPSSTPAGRNT